MRLARLLSLTTTRALQLFQLMRQGAVIAVSIVLAKSGLGLADIGTYESLLYVGTVLTFFWVSGLLQAMTPVHGRLADGERKAFIFNVFLVFCGLSALLCAGLWLGQRWVVPLLTGLPRAPYFGLFCAYLLLYLPTFPVEYIYLLEKKARHILAWGVASFGLQVVAVGAPLWWGGGLRESFWALIALNAVRWLWAAGLALRSGVLAWRPDLMRRYLAFAAPLMAGVVVGNLVLLFDNWLVGWWYRDEATFAVFRYGAREFPLALALATALGVSIVPRLTEDLAGGLADLKAMTRRLFHLIFPLTIGLLLLSKPLFPIVFNSDFKDSATIFNIYLLMTASRMLLPGSIVLALGAPHVIFQVGIIELAVKILLGFLFVYWWGLPGVAWSAVMAFWIEKVGLMWYLQQKQQIATEQWLDWKIYLIYCGLLILAYLLTEVMR